MLGSLGNTYTCYADLLLDGSVVATNQFTVTMPSSGSPTRSGDFSFQPFLEWVGAGNHTLSIRVRSVTGSIGGSATSLGTWIGFVR